MLARWLDVACLRHGFKSAFGLTYHQLVRHFDAFTGQQVGRMRLRLDFVLYVASDVLDHGVGANQGQDLI